MSGSSTSLLRLGMILIVAVLALFVVPLWRLDTEADKQRALAQARAVQSMRAAQDLKVMVAEFHSEYGEFPRDMEDLGVTDDQQALFDSRGLELAGDGVIHARLKTGSGKLAGSLSLSPRVGEVWQGLRWQCTSTMAVQSFMPQCEQRVRGHGG